MKNFLISVVFFSVLFSPLSIISQESEGIEEVIVTAEKKESNLQDVPTVIDVLTASQIEDMNITTTRDVDAALPSLIVKEVSASPPIVKYPRLSALSYPIITQLLLLPLVNFENIFRSFLIYHGMLLLKPIPPLLSVATIML